MSGSVALTLPVVDVASFRALVCRGSLVRKVSLSYRGCRSLHHYEQVCFLLKFSVEGFV